MLDDIAIKLPTPWNVINFKHIMIQAMAKTDPQIKKLSISPSTTSFGRISGSTSSINEVLDVSISQADRVSGLEELVLRALPKRAALKLQFDEHVLLRLVRATPKLKKLVISSLPETFKEARQMLM